MKHTKSMANKIYKNRDLAVFVMRCVLKDDVIGAKNLLVGIDEQDKKMIVSTVVDRRVPLFVAAERGNTDMVKFLVKDCQADINTPDKYGRTCLRNSAHNLELCQLLIECGARVNDKDNLGDTALHIAILFGHLEIVQLLLDHGSDQNIRNNQGDDALQLASLHGKDSIVMELVARQEPTPSRWVESQQLLGIHSLFSDARDVTQALIYWKTAVTLRLTNPYADLRKIEQPPVFRDTKEVNTVEELEELCKDEQMAYMYAIENRLRIVNLCHQSTIDGLYKVCDVFTKNESYRRSFELLKYAFQLLVKARTQTWPRKRICRWAVLN